MSSTRFPPYLLVLLLCACGQAVEDTGPAAERIDYSPSYSPDGSRIAFVSEHHGRKTPLVINADGSDERRLMPGEADMPVWSPDGTKIAFCSKRSGNQEVYVMVADGSDPANLTNHSADDCHPAWSPDGTRILFMSTRDGDWEANPEDNWEIYVMASDGSDQRRLTGTPGYDLITGQAWSPDGSRIVFCSTMDGKYAKGPDRFDDFDLYIMNADGSGIRQLTFAEGQDSYAYWSPVGDLISYTHVDKDAPIEASGGENYEIYTIRPDGTGIRRLTHDPGYDFEGWWSPDGSRMVYSSSRDEPQGIFVMDADGSDKTRLTNKSQ